MTLLKKMIAVVVLLLMLNVYSTRLDVAFADQPEPIPPLY